MQRSRTLRRRAGSLALTGGAVLGVVCLLLTVVAPLVGVRPLIYLSGSMSPTIPAGSLALAKETPASELRVGDVVTVPHGETHLTHRIVEITQHDGAASLRLRGDANEVADATTYRVTSAPTTFVSVPHVGAVVAWLSRPPGVFLLAGYAALVIGSLRRPRGDDRDDGDDEDGAADGPDGRRAGRLGAKAAAGALVVSCVAAVPAHAAWVDTVDIDGTAVTAATVTPPVVRCGLLSIGSTELRWSAVPGATGYLVRYGTNGSSVDEVGADVTSKTFTGTTSGTFSVRAVFGVADWSSAESNAKTYSSLLWLLGTCL